MNDDNYHKTKSFLMPMASSVEEEYVREKHLGMTIDGRVVELHGHLYSGLSSRVERELDKLQEDTFYGGQVRSWMNGQTQIFLLKAENDAFYVFTHILQHFYKEGVGLRQICDWCRLLYTYRDSLNYGLLEQRIKRAGLMSEWKAFGALAIEYLGFPKDSMPLLDVRSKKEDVRDAAADAHQPSSIIHQPSKSHQPSVRDAAYYRRLAERIRLARDQATLRTMRFVTWCEQELEKRDLPIEGKGSLAQMETELYKRIDTIERVDGELKRRWQHCLATVIVRLMQADGRVGEERENEELSESPADPKTTTN
jgi:hypothetical protein